MMNSGGPNLDKVDKPDNSKLLLPVGDHYSRKGTILGWYGPLKSIKSPCCATLQAAKGITPSAITACSERDHSVFNNCRKSGILSSNGLATIPPKPKNFGFPEPLVLLLVLMVESLDPGLGPVE